MDWTGFITVGRAAAILSVKDNTIRKLIEDGAISGVRVGRQWRLSEAKLIQFINNGGSGGFRRNPCADRSVRVN